MKIWNRLKAALIGFVFVITAVSCGAVKPTGTDRVEAFLTEASGFNSGRYLITNLNTGVTEQVFSFYFESDGTERFLLELSDGVNYSYSYYNGVDLTNSAGEKTSVNSSYTRENPYPMGDGSLLFYVPELIAESREFTDDADNTVFEYIYDTEQLNTLSNTDYNEFMTVWVFNNKDEFVLMSRSITNKDGMVEIYQMEVIDVNGVFEIIL
ncbi:MAG: hypothetical protein LBM87_05930 [Ruminococcus sp.]|jgi:hypothetical protein|nr:hypothetical protein [Ruminococcus sp.]